MPTRAVKCRFCRESFPASAERCPHCARPGLFENVRAAMAEGQVLRRRYRKVLREAAARGTSDALRVFETQVDRSRAVIARPLAEVQRLATSATELYATYYDRLDAGVCLPEGKKWDILRALTDDALFPGLRNHIRFGALTLGDHGPSNYGDCLLFLKDEFIRHRASVFEENSVLWMQRQRILMSEADNLPKGYRATWRNRAKLAVAKLGHRVDAGKTSFANLLLHSGATTADDDFIEVHIWGPLTVRSLDSVKYITGEGDTHAKRAIRAALGETLHNHGVKLLS